MHITNLLSVDLSNMLPLLLLFLPLVYGTESPLCAECDCQLGYGNLYSVNCTSDVTNLFEGWYWIDPNDKTYPFKVVTIANSRLDRLDKQFPRSSMESLSLLNCHITYISESTFGKLAYLEKLILSHNRIENLHPKAFAGVYSNRQYRFLPLKRLYLDHNSITSLDREVFKYSRDIEILSLAHNPLQAFTMQTVKAINSLDSLKKLDLSYTQLSTLPSRFRPSATLRYLDLDGNRFQEVPRELRALSKLRILHFSNNPIVRLTNESGFPNVTTLKILHMCNMSRLLEIGAGSLSELINLEQLYLSDNEELTVIHKDAFLKVDGYQESWPPVIELYLQNNKLSSLDMELLDWDVLEEIDLRQNSWRCECQYRWMTEDLFPNVILKSGGDQFKTLRCTNLDSTWFDVYKDKAMEGKCWTIHKNVLNLVYGKWGRFWWVINAVLALLVIKITHVYFYKK
jgi:hypothetical protein